MNFIDSSSDDVDDDYGRMEINEMGSEEATEAESLKWKAVGPSVEFKLILDDIDAELFDVTLKELPAIANRMFSSMGFNIEAQKDSVEPFHVAQYWFSEPILNLFCEFVNKRMNMHDHINKTDAVEFIKVSFENFTRLS